jgi:dTDP-3-amino-3,4,6-trideoxy-alpha-D-glucose transaminase
VRVPLFAGADVVAPLSRVQERMREVIASGRYILGPEVEAFEHEFSSYLGVGHCVGVANGTEALTIGLRALGIGPGDEVVVPALTFYATAEAVVNAGATPVFCDVDPSTYCMTAATAEPAIGERTAALLPVHLFGNPAPMAELHELAASRGLALVEDAAQAAGATLDGRRAGSLGDLAGFSFYPAKNLGAFGDGGAIVTSDPGLAAKARRLRFHGSDDKVTHTEVGYNSRLDEIQAAGLRVLLPELDAWNGARREAARAYEEKGLGELVSLPVETAGAESCWHLYVPTTPERDRLRAHLADFDIETRPYYTVPLHLQPGLAAFAGPEPLPEAERVARTGLALPMGPGLDEAAIEAVVAAITASPPAALQAG